VPPSEALRAHDDPSADVVRQLEEERSQFLTGLAQSLRVLVLALSGKKCPAHRASLSEGVFGVGFSKNPDGNGDDEMLGPEGSLTQ
jgi:hypothetical protein